MRNTLGTHGGGLLRRLGVLGITFLGLWTLYGAVGAFLGAFQLFGLNADEGTTPVQVALIVAPGLIMIGFSVALIMWRQRVASALFPDEPVDLEVSPVPALRMILIVSGLFISVSALSGLIYSMAQRFAQSISDRMLFGIPGESTPVFSIVAGAAPHAVELLIGLALVAFSAPIASRLWNGKRATPTPAPVPAADSRCPECGTPYDPSDYVPGSEARCVECGSPLDLTGA